MSARDEAVRLLTELIPSSDLQTRREAIEQLVDALIEAARVAEERGRSVILDRQNLALAMALLVLPLHAPWLVVRWWVGKSWQ